MIIETERLFLYPLTLEDLITARSGRAALERALGLVALGIDPVEEARMIPLLEELILRVESDIENILWTTNWEIILKEENRIIGGLSFYQPPVSGKVEIAYIIQPDYHNRGYCTEALQSIFSWAFKNGAEEIIAEIEKFNKPSIRLAEKLGMRLSREKEESLIYSSLKMDWMMALLECLG